MTEVHYRNFIDGRFVESSSRFEDIDPATGRVRAIVHEADKGMVEEAVGAARRALDGAWGRTTIEERASLLDRVADAIDRRKADFLEAEVGDTGKPASLAGSLDIPRGAANFRTFANIIRTSPG
ncbi:aldehyde dehydrogenase family protein, partial [Sphingobium sp. AM]|uniref:aldehyde dehydrogenase family protein n=1 Tax=Sphingobium sp. AM TaxID=1176302 RepID=UPI000AF18B65